MRTLLADTGSAELGHWLAFLPLEDERQRLETAYAIGLALGGSSEQQKQAAPDEAAFRNAATNVIGAESRRG